MRGLKRSLVSVLLGTLPTLAAIMPAAAGVDLRCNGHDATIVGTDRNDRLAGTPGRDVIVGRDGDDDIRGFGGNDVICAGNGADTIQPGKGRDYVNGGYPNKVQTLELMDHISYVGSDEGVTVRLEENRATGEGRDRLVWLEHIDGSQHNDVLRGSRRWNVIRGHGGDDVINTFDPKELDTAIGGGGDDRIVSHHGQGGPGNDDIRANRFTFPRADQGIRFDMVEGTATGEGNDTVSILEMDTQLGIHGTRFDDVLRGSDGGVTDFILGSRGDDRLVSDGTDPRFVDYLYPGPGDDVLDGSEGAARVIFQTGPLVIDLGVGTASGEGEDTLISIDELSASSRGDIIRGSDDAERIEALGGEDEIYGLGGNDVLRGGGPSAEPGDLIDGGDGSDDCGGGEVVSNCESGSLVRAIFGVLAP
jgi:Ca2+-binding RTX toxin-like protein